MNIARRVARRYRGGRAASYDAHRIGSDRHDSEIAALRAYVDRIQPTSVLDAPIGTGRFVELYGSASVIGVDSSTEMLDQVDTSARRQLELVEGNLLDRRTVPTGPFDLVVCIRLLNWLPPDDARVVLANLARVARDHLVVGLTVAVPGATASKRSGWSRRPQPVVHDEAIVGELTAAGWAELERRETFRTDDRVNHLRLLTRRPA